MCVCVCVQWLCWHFRGDKKNGDDSDSDEDAEKAKLKSQLEGQQTPSQHPILLKNHIDSRS